MADSVEVRQLYRQYQQASARFWAQYQAWQATPVDLPLGLTRRTLTRALMARHDAEQALLATRPVFPEVCRELTCGARTRKGAPCKRRDFYGQQARCRLHGGCSTGPQTVEGKRRSAANGLRPKRKRTP